MALPSASLGLFSLGWSKQKGQKVRPLPISTHHTTLLNLKTAKKHFNISIWLGCQSPPDITSFS
jgi:hypothetical protein